MKKILNKLFNRDKYKYVYFISYFAIDKNNKSTVGNIELFRNKKVKTYGDIILMKNHIIKKYNFIGIAILSWRRLKQ